MEQQLYIDGMTCKNCTTGVMEKINSIEGVSNTKVSLETGKATFNSTQQIPLSQLSKLLGDRYTLSEVQEEFTKQELTTAAKLNALFPLFLIFGYLICATIFLSYLTNATIENAMLYFMGLFLSRLAFLNFLITRVFQPHFLDMILSQREVHCMRKCILFWKRA